MKFNKERQDYNKILDFLRGTMRRRKISQADIAYRLGLPQGAISKRLSGKVEFTLWELINLAEILDIEFTCKEHEENVE